MADNFTTNFKLGKPEVGNARQTWGYTLNDTIDRVEEALTEHRDGIAASVKKAGDAMTGALTFDTDSSGVVYSANTVQFDATNAQNGTSAHYLDVAGNTLAVRTEDGSQNLFVVNASGASYRGRSILIDGDGNYLQTTGGTINGNLTVTGTLRAPKMNIDDQWATYLAGAECVQEFAPDNKFQFNRGSKSFTWISNGGLRMTLDAGGNLTVPGDTISYSDARLKTDIEPIDGALEKILSLRGVTFTRIADGSEAIGVIAQEVERVFPQAVTTDEDGYKAVAYASLVAPLIEAVKYQNAEIAFLKSQVAALADKVR